MKNRIPGFKEQFEKLISIPSVSCIRPDKDMSNRPFLEALAVWLEDLGFKIELMPVHASPEKLNLIAVAGRGDGGLVLAGHSDTVPFDESGWNTDPFRLTESDNRFYGLGTSDMKCFFPLVMDCLRDLDVGKLKKPLFILATCDEESTMSGAKALAASGRTMGRHAMIGEPTALKPVNAHKGVMFESIRLIGRSGHSSDPSLGRSALEGMNRVINGLGELRSELRGEFSNPAFKIPYPTVNFGSIKGGDSPNRICGECELNMDIRLIPGMDLEESRARLRQRVMEAIDGLDLAVEFDPVFPGIPGMETSPDSDIVSMAGKLTGEPVSNVAFGTEAPFLNSIGMETIVLGPGDIEVAHQANEYLEMDRIEPMKTVIEGMIKRFCL